MMPSGELKKTQVKHEYILEVLCYLLLAIVFGFSILIVSIYGLRNFRLQLNKSTTQHSGEAYYTDPSCQALIPQRPTGLVIGYLPDGNVSLSWSQVSGVTAYQVLYGPRWLDFDFRVSSVTNSVVIANLTPNVGYYFVVTSVNGCANSSYSDGVAIYGKDKTEIVPVNYEWQDQNPASGKGGNFQNGNPEGTSPTSTVSGGLSDDQKKQLENKTTTDIVGQAVEQKVVPNKSIWDTIASNGDMFLVSGLFLVVALFLFTTYLYMRSQKNTSHQS